MNYSIAIADRAAHLKIVIVALFWTISGDECCDFDLLTLRWRQETF